MITKKQAEMLRRYSKESEKAAVDASWSGLCAPEDIIELVNRREQARKRLLAFINHITQGAEE